MCCLQNTKRPTRYCAFLFVGEYARFSNLSFALEGISQHVPDHWTPKNFTEVAGPESSDGLSFTLWSTCLTKAFSVLVTSSSLVQSL